MGMHFLASEKQNRDPQPPGTWNGRSWRPIPKLRIAEDSCKIDLLSIRGKVDSRARREKMRELSGCI